MYSSFNCQYELYDLRSISIRFVGEVKHLLSTKAKSAGSLRSPRSKKDYLSSTPPPDGFQSSYKEGDSTTGLLTPRTGVSQGQDTGETLFHFGSLMMERKLCVLAQ